MLERFDYLKRATATTGVRFGEVAELALNLSNSSSSSTKGMKVDDPPRESLIPGSGEPAGLPAETGDSGVWTELVSAQAPTWPRSHGSSPWISRLNCVLRSLAEPG
jgi:hypothetical protein